MKRILLLTIFIIMLLSMTITSSQYNEELYYGEVKRIPNKMKIFCSSIINLENIIEKKVYDVDLEFYKDRIPNEYLEVFLKSTENIKDLRLVIYSMMLLESQYFTEYENHKNSNGTSDYGPLMLNSSNIKNELFRKLYFPDDSFFHGMTNTNKDESYVIYTAACINLFKDHVEKYGVYDALRVYNAGPKVYRPAKWSTKFAKSKRYANKVNSILYSVEIEYKNHLEKANQLDKILYTIKI